MAVSEQVQILFDTFLAKCGHPQRKVQVTTDQMCLLLNDAVGDYMELMQAWVVEQQWGTLLGKDLNDLDITYALTTRTFDFTKDYSYWFSKEVGLQQRGPWELKKDFFQIECGKQCYVIPAGREINDVMYCTPSTTKAALYGQSGFDLAYGGMLQMGNTGVGMGFSPFYFGASYDTMLLAANLKYKNSMFRGDLAYKVTAGPNGTHIVHLLSTPGSPNSFRGYALDDAMMSWNRYANCYVWYTYYDTSNGDVDECRKMNNSIIITPDQVPMDAMQYEYLNVPGQQVVKKLFFSNCFNALAMTRGTFSGKVSIKEAELVMDYNMLINEANRLREEALKNLNERLDRMRMDNYSKSQADIAENLANIKKHKALPKPIMVR